MFMDCKSLISLPNFKFNEDKILDVVMTSRCERLANPPENLDTSYNNSECETESSDLDKSKTSDEDW